MKVVYRCSVDRARMFISSMDGDLTVKDLRPEDAGFYRCRFTGSDAQTIQLNVIIGMFELFMVCLSYKYE